MRALSAALALLLMSVPAAADDASCSCRNLQSLQEELENAEYLRDFYSKTAGELSAQEQKWADEKAKTGYGVDILASSHALMRKLLESRKLPHLPAKGYAGPAEVNMPFGSCEQDPTVLEEMRRGSQCKEIADITLEHEKKHRDLCATMGKEAYWARYASKLVAEESQRYAEQAQKLRDQLRRVIDASSVTVEAQLEPRISGPQFDVTYSYVTSPAELKGKSAAGSDSWTLNGKAVRTTTIKRARIAGMNCTGSGALKHDVTYALETDGMTMGLESTETSKSGNVKLTCKKGMGMSLMPIGEMGGGQVFSELPLQTETNFSEEIAGMPFGTLIRQNGLSVSGKHTVRVKLICPGEGN